MLPLLTLLVLFKRAQCPGNCSTVSAGETGETGETVVSMSGEVLPGWTQCQGHLTSSQVTLSVSLG